MERMKEFYADDDHFVFASRFYSRPKPANLPYNKFKPNRSDSAKIDIVLLCRLWGDWIVEKVVKNGNIYPKAAFSVYAFFGIAVSLV